MTEHWYPPYCREPPLIEYCGDMELGAIVMGRACNKGFVSLYSSDSYKPLEYKDQFIKWVFQNKIQGYTYYGKIFDVKKAEPGPPGTTSIVSILRTDEASYALKAYRLPTPDNLEPRVLEYLTKAGNNHVPSYTGHGEYGGYIIHLITSWLGESSVVPLLFDNAIYYMSKGFAEPLELAYEIGAAIASIHSDLELCSDILCAPEPVSEEDLSRWIFRIQWRLENMAIHEDNLVRDTVEQLYNRIDDVIELASNLRKGSKIRTHGDLHLYQVFIDKNTNIKILDFEGEPDRMPGTPFEKETSERDLACLLRSLHYVAANAYLSKNGEETVFEASRKVLHEHGEWISSTFEKILEGYRAKGRNPSLEAIFFWSIERALYEFYYESMWRTGLEHIPLAWLEHVTQFLGGKSYPFLLTKS